MAGFQISADLVRALEHQVELYGEVANDAYHIAAEVVYDETMRRAQASPRWVHVADNIDVWDENDRMWIGVRSPEMVSEAYAAEYGTDEYPPDPLFRTLDDTIRNASMRASGFMLSRLGGAVT